MIKSIVAAKGFNVTLLIANISFNVTQYAPVDISQFTKKQIEASNLSILLKEGWAVVYEEQALPKNPKQTMISKISQTTLKSENTDVAKFTTQEKKGGRVETSVELPKDFSDKIHERLTDAQEQDNAKKQQQLENFDDAEDGSIRPETPEKLSLKDLKRTLVKDGEVVESFEAPRIKKSIVNQKETKEE